jgi:uncharacterized protein (TIGR02687 family)
MLSDTIKARLAERFSAPLPDFHKRRIVFWHDESGEFAEQVDEVSLPGVTLVKLTGRNNFTVKKLLTADDLTGDYLVYNPINYDKPQDNWLLDIELYSGEPFRADLVSMQMEELNIEPTSAMRKTVKLYTKFMENKDRKAKLKKIGRSYHTPLSLHTDIMAVLCGLNGGSTQDVIVAVLSAGLGQDNPALDTIARFGSIEAFWQMVQKFTGYENSAERPVAELAEHILVTALSQTMSVAALKGLERFVSESCTTYCYQLIREWQFSESSGVLYEICRHVERELRLADRFDKIDIEALLKSDTLPSINESMLKRVFSGVADKVLRVEDILRMVENRRTAAWYGLSESYFECLYYIAKMQEFYLAHIEGFHIVEPKGIWGQYTNDAYQMDSHYRHFHTAFGNTLRAPNSLLDDGLKKSAEVVEGLYHQWYLKELTASWTGVIADDLKTLGYVSEIAKQREFYRKYVHTSLGKANRVFVVISDALRYEVAAELSETLSRTTKGKAMLESMQTIFPGITPFGMAALLPGKDISVGDKLDVLVDGNQTNSTALRAALLAAENKSSVAVQYADLLQMKMQERRELVTGKEVVYIYHNVIDAIGETPQTGSKVFEACETAISELAGIVRIIVNELSSTNIFITSDHGFLYTYRPLDESQKISRQTFAGEVYELGRRYALTAPDTTAEYLLPVNTQREIGGTPMMGYTSQDTVRIKVQGGGNNYVHGGVSLQEMVVPVIVYKGMRTDSKHYVEVKNPGLTLISESRKVANLMFSLDFLQKEAVGEKVQPCVYTVHFTDGEGVVISDRQTIIADKTSVNASDRVFRIRFNLKSIAFDRNSIYRLVIANDTDVPEEIEFRINIAFADDFGFDL